MKKKIISFILLFSLMLMPIAVVNAEDYAKADGNIEESETYNHSFFLAGNDVNSNAIVNGLSFTAGNNVRLGGRVEYGFVAGDSITINTNVEKDLFVAGSTIVLDKEATIGRDVFAAGNSILLRTNVSKLFAAGTKITLDNITINGDVNLAVENLEILGNVNINGKLTINEEANIINSSNLSYTNKETYKASRNFSFNWKSELTDLAYSLLTTIFTGILLFVIFPKLPKKIKYELSVLDVFKKLGWGLLVLIVGPVIAILSLAIIVGISFSAIIALSYLISLLLATIFASFVIGTNIFKLISKEKENTFVSLLIGIIVVKIISLVPVIGSLITFLAFIYGLGLIWTMFLNREK